MANEIEKLVAPDGAMLLKLENILRYWGENTMDKTHGGFYGQINNLNEVNETADKGGGMSLSQRPCPNGNDAAGAYSSQPVSLAQAASSPAK